MEPGRMTLCRLIAFALLGTDMDKYCMAHPLGLLESPDELINIMTVHRAQVRDAHILKEHSRNHQLLQAAFCLLQLPHDAVAVYRNLLQGALQALSKVIISLRGTHTIQVLRQTAHILRDGHLVIIQNDNKITL